MVYWAATPAIARRCWRNGRGRSADMAGRPLRSIQAMQIAPTAEPSRGLLGPRHLYPGRFGKNDHKPLENRAVATSLSVANVIGFSHGRPDHA